VTESAQCESNVVCGCNHRLHGIEPPAERGSTPFQISVPASCGQRFLREVGPGAGAHSVAVTLRCRGEPDIVALEYAFDALAARHASVRATFRSSDSGRSSDSSDPEPVRRLAGRARASLRENDARELDDAQFAKWLEYVADEPFDLARGPLLRIHLVGMATGEAVVLVVAHRSIADVWSMTTLVCELETLYSRQTGGMPASLPEPTVTHKDFVRLYRWVSGSRASVHAALSPDSPAMSHARRR
jgi:hypothetical protein